MPPLLHSNLDLRDNLLKFCKDNINHLSLEVIHDYLLSDTLSNLAKTIEKEQNIGTYICEQLMTDNGLKTLSLTTVQRWMKKLGFKFEPKKKTYYIDNHDSPENVELQSILRSIWNTNFVPIDGTLSPNLREIKW